VCCGGGGVKMLIDGVDVSCGQVIFGLEPLGALRPSAAYMVRVDARAIGRFGGPETARITIEAPCDRETADRLGKACCDREFFDVAEALLAPEQP
jgi:hypothetical protein